MNTVHYFCDWFPCTQIRKYTEIDDCTPQMYNLLLSFLYTCIFVSTTIKLYWSDIVIYYNSFLFLSVPCYVSYFFIRLYQLVAYAVLSYFC